MLSFNDEGFLGRAEAERILAARGQVTVIERDHPRYVGARIGIHNPAGEKVGRVGRLRNREYLFVAGPTPWSPVPPAATQRLARAEDGQTDRSSRRP